MDIYKMMDDFMSNWYKTHNENEQPSIKDISVYYPDYTMQVYTKLLRLIKQMYFTSSHI